VVPHGRACACDARRPGVSDPSEQPLVSVIIPARDAAATIERTLGALRAQKLGGPFEVIVVDNGSRDETAAIVERHRPFARLISRERGEGPGAARNHGVQIARGPILAFTDADCFPTPRWLEHGLAKARDADLVQGRVEPDPAAARTPFDRTLAVEADRGFYQTANLFVRREVFDAVGGFKDWALYRSGVNPSRHDSAMGRPVGEDTLFAWSARRLGATGAFAPDALVYHVVVPGDVLDAMTDRWRWARHMPGLARLVPELREQTFYHRWFFDDWTAKLDLAVAGLAVAALTRKPAPLIGVLPYLDGVRRQSMAYRVGPGSRAARLGRAAIHAIGQPAVDGATVAGLIAGSLAYQCPVL
jgi:glycosyltransferase involved in cell wall biosynthesis